MAKPFERVRTRQSAQFRLFVLVAVLGSVEFFLNAASLYVPRPFMFVAWVGAGFGGVAGSILFEKYKLRQARWSEA